MLFGSESCRFLACQTRSHSDQGSEFINSVMSKVCQLLGINKTQTTAYHPQGNAYAERIHRFFRSGISAFVSDDQRNWDELVHALMLAYNNSLHEALGVSPVSVFLGRTLATPG